MLNKMKLLLFFLCAFLISSCKKDISITNYEEQDWLAGGSQTVFETGSGAYSQTFPVKLSGTALENHEIGDALFESTFITAPAPKNAGLGPLFNAVSCASCHNKDGRGSAPEDGGHSVSLFLKVSEPGVNEHGGPLDLPGFGVQIQPKATYGKQGEAEVNVHYTYETGTFEDGTTYELRKPTFTIDNPYIPLPGNYLFSPRFSRPVFGMGLLEAIAEATVLMNVDEYDLNNDGISGKANFVWNFHEQKMSLGRFGWKAGVPTVLQQVAAAFNQDIGLTNFIFPYENSFKQVQYDNLTDEVELSDSLVYASAMYIRTLAVPARRNVQDPEVIRGKQLFNDAACVKCHTPKHKTKVNMAFPALSNQTIYPYTDLLLHDMGPNLADNRPEYLAEGVEWRTPPLWGIGLSQAVNNHSNFLHDGRARNINEAILWHGGEASQSKILYKKMSASDRKALLKFLNSL
jgi:CxxC motif-containing protein (DUF1111 family)